MQACICTLSVEYFVRDSRSLACRTDKVLTRISAGPTMQLEHWSGDSLEMVGNDGGEGDDEHVSRLVVTYTGAWNKPKIVCISSMRVQEEAGYVACPS